MRSAAPGRRFALKSPLGRWNPPSRRRGRASRRADPEAAARVPVGPRAGRALDRAAHGRRGVRARAGRARRRRREAARRARRRALPGALPVAAARGARARVAGRRWPTTCTPSSCAGTRTSSARSRSTAPGEVLRNWDQIKKGEDGPRAGDLRRRAGEPARAAVRAQDAAPGGVHGLRLRPRALRAACAASWTSSRRPQTREERFHEVGDVLFAAVNVARKLKVDPELALRASRERFRGRVEAAAELARARRRRVGRARPRRAARLLRRAGLSGLVVYRGRRHEPDRNGPRTPDP